MEKSLASKRKWWDDGNYVLNQTTSFSQGVDFLSHSKVRSILPQQWSLFMPTQTSYSLWVFAQLSIPSLACKIEIENQQKKLDVNHEWELRYDILTINNSPILIL